MACVGRVRTASPLRPWEDARASWALPVVAAGVAASLLGAAAELGDAAQRSAAFALGPAVLLVTLHARTAGYLHDDGLAATLPLPIPPARRFAAAGRRHALGLAWQGAWAALAFGVSGRSVAASTILVADVLVLVAMAALVEPLAAAAAAWLGRRVPAESIAGQLQRSLGGGWTLPEAVVHLWAPAAGLALAAALAMPGQLAIDRWAEGVAPGTVHLELCAAAVAVAVLGRVLAPRIYAGGLFDAVPWLRQAMRTLAGPPVPSAAPRWLPLFRDPALRLLVLQHQRLTPVPVLRLLLLLGAATFLATRAEPPGIAELGILVGLVALWLVPAGALARHAADQRRLLGPLPLRDARPRAWACLLAPVALAVAPLLVRVVRLGGAT